MWLLKRRPADCQQTSLTAKLFEE